MKQMICFLMLTAVLVVPAYSGTVAQISGLVIHVSNDSIEIKKGNKEITLYMTPDTKIFFKGKEAGRRAVDICQKVKAGYVVKDNRKELVTLEIQRESYCAL